MNFLDGSLFPENQDRLIITAAPAASPVAATGAAPELAPGSAR